MAPARRLRALGLMAIGPRQRPLGGQPRHGSGRRHRRYLGITSARLMANAGRFGFAAGRPSHYAIAKHVQQGFNHPGRSCLTLGVVGAERPATSQCNPVNHEPVLIHG